MTDRPDLDQETRDAIAALAHRIHARDQAPEDERADPEPFALDFVMKLRLRGWRPTPATPVVVWPRPAGGRGTDPREHADALRQARSACERAVAKHRAASAREDREGGEES